MTGFVHRAATSIASQVTLVAVGAFLCFAIVLISLLQTPFSTLVYPRTVADNARYITNLTWLIEQASPQNQALILQTYQSQGRAAALTAQFGDHLGPDADLSEAFSNLEANGGRTLQGRRIEFASLGPPQLSAFPDLGGPGLFSGAYALQIAIALEDGRVLNIWLAPSVSVDRRPAALTSLAVISLFFAISLSAAVAFVVNRPIRRLERDAGQVELADAGGTVSEEGPVELRRLAAALNQMRRRLAGLISEREQIIAAIAHDVRTGLTRVRLRLDEDETVTAQELEADLSQMEHLVADMVAYARAESPTGHRELIKMGRFLREMASESPTQVRFESDLESSDEFTIAGDPVALRRLFENLIENARRYGGGGIQLVVAIDQGALLARLEDNGQGLPEDQLESVFKPFHRLESSRNRATGGSGLGLGIARSIAIAHGASLSLENRAEGGLVAIVRFPESIRT